MGSNVRRAPVLGMLVAVVLAATLGSCTRPGSPGSPGSTTTTPPAGPGASGRYARPVFTAIEKVATGVTYAPADPAADRPDDLELDVWAPAGDTAGRRPAVVWGFGGGFTVGDRSQLAVLAEDSARRGYVGITIDYRLRGVSGNPDSGIVPAYLDTVTAGEWLRANAARYRIDPDAIIAAGASAGAMNAINAIVLPGEPLPDFPDYFQVPPGTVNPQTSPYAAAISDSGAAAGPMARPPLVVSRPGQAPIIMFAGTADDVVNYQDWQLKTCEDHKARGNVCEFVSYQDGIHMVPFQIGDVLDRSAIFVKEQVLIPHGYPADQ
jgi:hypothetical protein